MNFLVFLDTGAGELEKILSGVKSIVVKECDPEPSRAHMVNPGDSLYFLRDKDDCALRVKATVTRVLFFTNNKDEEQSQSLKELQSRLQLTEDQYNHWSAKGQMFLVEFRSAQKIGMIYVAPHKITDRSGWIPFEDFSLIT